MSSVIQDNLLRVIMAQREFVLRNRLRVARAERDLSQERLAELAGVTRQTISAVENNQYVPSALLAFVLAHCVGKPVDQVFTLEEARGDDEGRT